jgi:5-methylcytosine-specific restriction endonuclease McrA
MQTLCRTPYPSILQNTVVVFSKNYLPMSQISLRRAAALLVTGQAEPVDYSIGQIWEIRSPSLVLQVPEHIRMTGGNPERHWKMPPVNRRGVLTRDKYLCQYCGSRHNLTMDHVIPRSKGGQHTWENVVAACVKCNGMKGDKLLHETQMQLRSQPKAPIHPTIAFADRFWHSQRAYSS